MARCWSHARRKLRELSEGRNAPIAEDGLRRIAGLYRIEAEIRGRSPEDRLAARRERSTRLVNAFGDWVEEHRARVSTKSPPGEALRYIFKLWDGLNRFLEDGRVEIDSNAAERAMRAVASVESLCPPLSTIWKH